MKVSIVCPDLAVNCLGRAWVLARGLERRWEVEIVGPLKPGAVVWPPVAGEGLRIRAVEADPRGPVREVSRRVAEAIDGDVIYASKPRPSSFGPAFLARRRRGVPLAADVDDWEAGFLRNTMRRRSLRGKVRYAWRDLAALRELNRCERMTRLADAVTVSNAFLGRRFGGVVVHHARDVARLDPARFDGGRIRAELGCGPDDRTALFLGTVRPHKGLEELIEAAATCGDRLHLAIVGMEDRAYDRSLAETGRRLLGGRFHALGMQPVEAAPHYLAAADVVVIPQSRNAATIGQMPAKIYDAMAMARPVVATAVNDIPEALHGCGWVIPPDDRGALARALAEAISDPAEAKRRGEAARARCIERYSLEAARETLETVFAPFE